MGPFQMLAAVAANDPSSQVALYQWLAGPARRYVPEPHREEVHQLVSIKLLTDAPAIFGRLLARDPELARRAGTPAAVLALEATELDVADRRFARYVHAMMRNRHQDLRRRDQKAPGVASLDALEDVPVDGDDPLAHIETERLMSVIERLRSELGERDRQRLEEIRSLSAKQCTMEQLVDRDLTSRGLDGADSGERTASRNRLYTNHRRTRKKLAGRIRALVESGDLAAEHGDTLRLWIDDLRRRQTTDRTDVSEGRREP
jgi:hypothetical protein